MSGRYFGRTLHRDYTDLAVVIGPSVHWVEDDYEDLTSVYPEVLLGYRVRLAVPTIRPHGLRISKLVVFNGPYSSRDLRLLQDWVVSTQISGGTVENWNVHRGKGIRRIGTLEG